MNDKPKQARKREPGAGRKPCSPLGPRTDRASFRIDAELLPRLLDYEKDVQEYSRTETLNAALLLYLDKADVPEDDWNEIENIFSRTFPERYIRTVEND